MRAPSFALLRTGCATCRCSCIALHSSMQIKSVRIRADQSSSACVPRCALQNYSRKRTKETPSAFALSFVTTRCRNTHTRALAHRSQANRRSVYLSYAFRFAGVFVLTSSHFDKCSCVSCFHYARGACVKPRRRRFGDCTLWFIFERVVFYDATSARSAVLHMPFKQLEEQILVIHAV